MFKNVLHLKFKSMQIGSVNVKVNHHESFVEITYLFIARCVAICHNSHVRNTLQKKENKKSYGNVIVCKKNIKLEKLLTKQKQTHSQNILLLKEVKILT